MLLRLLSSGLVLVGCAKEPAVVEPPPPDAPVPGDGPPVTAFAYPRGCYTVSAATSGPVDAALLANPGLTGIAVSIEWRELERAGDQEFDWTAIDARVAEITATGKPTIIGVVASAAKAPDWLVARPDVTKHEIVDPNENHGTGTITVVPFWDPVFRAQKLELIRAAGEHFAGNPQVVGVLLGFANYYTNDWAIPADMVDGNYSYATMIDIGKEVLQTAADAFPGRAIKLPLGKNDPTTDLDKTETQMADDIVAFATHASFADRFFAQKNLINTASPRVGDPRLDDPDPSTNDYLLAALRDLSPHMGLQMVASATGGPNDGCRQNAHRSPCPAYDVMDVSLQIALSYRPTFVELWTGDAENPDLYPLVSAASQAMIQQ
ncbi:MAG: beta-galactosidase [Kofleriaceae bacterium]